VQVDLRSTPGRLRLASELAIFDEPLSKFDFDANLRHSRVVLFDAVNQWSLLLVAPLIYASSIAVGWCMLTPSRPRIGRAWFQR